MSEFSVLREKAEMFERRAERATDPISIRARSVARSDLTSSVPPARWA
jgi:hypothetical protein